MMEYRVKGFSVAPGLTNTNFKLHLSLDVVNRKPAVVPLCPYGQKIMFNEIICWRFLLILTR